MSRGYVENVAQAAVLATSSDRATGRTYNVGEVDSLSEAEWVREIAAALGDGEVVADPEAPPPAQDIYADTSRIRAELGYVESISRPEGLRRTVERERAQPN
jgi:nucleoside-diphosphate-sugar epimerase